MCLFVFQMSFWTFTSSFEIIYLEVGEKNFELKIQILKCLNASFSIFFIYIAAKRRKVYQLKKYICLLIYLKEKSMTKWAYLKYSKYTYIYTILFNAYHFLFKVELMKFVLFLKCFYILLFEYVHDFFLMLHLTWMHAHSLLDVPEDTKWCYT